MKVEHAADSLKYQWRVLGVVLRSDWATSLDKSIAFEIIDNYRKANGNSRASLSYLMAATGANRKSVIASTRRLVEHGPFSVFRQGVGTRPTEYNIDFGSVQENASGGARDTTSEIQSSSGAEATTGSGARDTTKAASGGADTTESVLHGSVLQDGVRDRTNECAAPMAPPASGLTAAAAGSAQGGFDELWKAYSHPERKADARRAYNKLAPSPELHNTLIASATAWRERWAEQGKADAPRYTLAKWIEREEYDCQPPKGYERKPRAAANSNKKPKPGPLLPDDKTHLMTIKRQESEGNPFEDFWATFILDADGTEIEQRLHIKAAGEPGPDGGKYNELMRAIGYNAMESEAEIIGARLLAANDGKKGLNFYVPPPAA
jgi:hypothetical protein